MAGLCNGARLAGGNHREFKFREEPCCFGRLRLHTPHHMQITGLFFMKTVYIRKQPEEMLQKGRAGSAGSDGMNELFFFYLLNERLLGTHCQKI